MSRTLKVSFWILEVRRVSVNRFNITYMYSKVNMQPREWSEIAHRHQKWLNNFGQECKYLHDFSG